MEREHGEGRTVSLITLRSVLKYVPEIKTRSPGFMCSLLGRVMGSVSY